MLYPILKIIISVAGIAFQVFYHYLIAEICFHTRRLLQAVVRPRSPQCASTQRTRTRTRSPSDPYRRTPTTSGDLCQHHLQARPPLLARRLPQAQAQLAQVVGLVVVAMQAQLEATRQRTWTSLWLALSGWLRSRWRRVRAAHSLRGGRGAMASRRSTTRGAMPLCPTPSTNWTSFTKWFLSLILDSYAESSCLSFC